MTAASRAGQEVPGWRDLRHGGLLLDGQRLADLASHAPDYVGGWTEHQLRRRATDEAPAFVKFVLEEVCGFDSGSGTWTRGTKVAPEWSRRAPTGEIVKPRQLWEGLGGGRLPVFMEPGPRVGIGKGRRTVSRVLGWLRAGNDHLALVTNGKQWRLLFAGLDFEAWCEWDVDLWFQEGRPAPQVDALRTLLSPKLWTPASKDAAPPLLQAIRDTRKGQAELSETLGERVREAVEVLIQGHGEALKEQCADVDPADIYRAACRVAMRLVVILFAEARDLLPRDNPVYHASYGLNGLIERLQSAAGGHALSRRFSAWPQVQALFTLVHDGSHLPQMPVKDYGGELFKPGSAESADGLSRALAVFETACLKHDVLPDDDVRRMLEGMTLTRVQIRQGRGGTWVTMPVDFSDLSSDYIGILYEGLLDYELKTAPSGEPVIFLAAGRYPALPLSRLKAMDDNAIKALFSNLKKDASADEGWPEEAADQTDASETDGNESVGTAGPLFSDPGEASSDCRDPRLASRTRAEKWAWRAASVAGLVKKPRGKLTPERRLKAGADLARAARKLVARVVLPGEWYLVRWGGTRKGSGSFYARPGLVVPTVRRTLQPLAYDPPPGDDGEPDSNAPATKWTPKRPEQILDLKVCDPACGSGAFALSALRFLSDALLASLQHHSRIQPHRERTMVRLLGVPDDDAAGERLDDELIPCPQDHDEFESRLRAVLRRHVVERCIYAVDLDPLAVELCRLSLWIETMNRTLPFGFLDHKVKCGNSLVGAWFDQFAHYPVMAWKNRQGGDQNHANGVHFKKNARTNAIRAFVRDTLTHDLQLLLRDPDFFQGDYLARLTNVHGRALTVLEDMHDLPVHDAAARASMYRERFVGSPEWQSIKEAMDLWCACWFWPADQIKYAPLPRNFADPPVETRSIARRICERERFFHWELEFPDVFRGQRSGFDAVYGNPPWENLQPNPEEFFSVRDPLFRSYGRLVKQRWQREIFGANRHFERAWLDYIASFRAFANWVAHRANPCGDPNTATKQADVFALGTGGRHLHDTWRQVRSRSISYSDSHHHPFQRQIGRVFTYKLFLELFHSLLKLGGRCGIIVPSGIYSDAWSRPLRDMFLDDCSWEWLFGFDNRDKIFPIHRSEKFCPIVLEKGGTTNVIRTAFMRHRLEDWEGAEETASPVSRDLIKQYSPKSRIVVENQVGRDLDILEKIYANAVRLSDDGPHCWAVKHSLEFMMNTDAHLFPPLPQWEDTGYHPDEYSRWIRGNWQPIERLWPEIDVEPDRVVPASVELEGWMFDRTSRQETRDDVSTRYVHGHNLKPGDVSRTKSRLRCAQPSYDKLPVERAAIPEGVILSRDGDKWIWEENVEDVALPLYEGRMIGQFDVSQKGWVSGKGRTAVWRSIPWLSKQIEPQFLMSAAEASATNKSKIAFMDVTSSTNSRSTICTPVSGVPCGATARVLRSVSDNDVMLLCMILNSLVYDFVFRLRLSGLHASWFLVEETPVLPKSRELGWAMPFVARLLNTGKNVCLPSSGWNDHGLVVGAVTTHERLRVKVIIDVLVTVLFGLGHDELRHILRQCDLPADQRRGHELAPKGFWRIDKTKKPELRQTVLTLVAYQELEEMIDANGGDRIGGLQRWLSQNAGEGWLIPETVRLADYGLGHDERARHSQPVASRLGPRYYDWQLAQTSEEAWRERHLAVRNLHGREAYRGLAKGMRGRKLVMKAAEPRAKYPSDLFAEEDPS